MPGSEAWQPTESSFLSSADGTEIATYAWTDARRDPRSAPCRSPTGSPSTPPATTGLARALNAAGFVGLRDRPPRPRPHRARTPSATSGGRLGRPHRRRRPATARRSPPTTRGLPVFLFGHSMGSFAAQSVIADHCRARMPGSSSPARRRSTSSPRGWPRPTPTARRASRPSTPASSTGTGFEWLSRDEAEVDAYVADPWCGFDTPPETIPMLFGQAPRLADPAVLGRDPHPTCRCSSPRAATTRSPAAASSSSCSVSATGTPASPT